MIKVLEASLSYYGSKEQRKDNEQENRNKESTLRMKHGKSWKNFTADVEVAKNRLRPGEVKRWDPEKKQYVSNLDK
jgi:hypothetical protein